MTLMRMTDLLSQLQVHEIIQIVLVKLEPEMAQQNRDQLLKGMTSTDQQIRPEYSQQTRKRKGFSTPNLYETGAFQRDIYAEVRDTTIDLNSRDEKTAKLELRYGKIFGLGEQGKRTIREKGSVALINNVATKLQLL